MTTVNVPLAVDGATIPSFSCEDEFQAYCEKVASDAGWRVLHILDMRYISNRSANSWPDLVIIKPPYFEAYELKMENNYATDGQKAMLFDFQQCGIQAKLLYPTQLTRWVKHIKDPVNH